MATVEEILSALSVEIDPAKAAIVKEWNGKLSASATEAQAQLADAQKKIEEAQSLQRVIDDNIRTAGLTETNLAQLQANNAALTAANAALTAAIEDIKKQGFSGINIPELPKVTPSPAADPMKSLTDLITQGFTQMGQTLNEMNRYQRVFGQPIPEDPATIADRAAKSRLSVRDYMEQTYKISAKEQEVAAARTAAHEKSIGDAAVEAYKAAHPVTTGHPELGPGVPSNYPNIPKPREAKSVREFSQMSPMQKIQDAKNRVTKEVQSRLGAA